MNDKPKSRNRLRGMYEENAAALAADYHQLKRRLLDLNLASLRNTLAIDEMLQRLQAAPQARLGH